jgi:plastocyanin
MKRRQFVAVAATAGAAASLGGCLQRLERLTEEQRPVRPPSAETTTEEAAETTTGTGTTTGAGTNGTGGADGSVTRVAVGPEGRLRFVPETVEISVGDTVRWTFESPGHNVTTKPGASERISIPDDAEPFGSYPGDQHFRINEVGTTYDHRFTVPGEYVYVCEPHADQGMVGTVVVTD